MYATSALALLALPYLTHATPIQPRDTAACTDTSLDFAWSLQNFDYHASYIFTTPAHQNSWGYVNFNLTNPADGSLAQCSAASSQLSDFFYGNQVYTCQTTPTTATTTFDFNKASGELRVNQTWRCDEKFPARYTGAGNVTLPLDCSERVYQNANWTLGQIYSSRDITCKPISLPLALREITGVA